MANYTREKKSDYIKRLTSSNKKNYGLTYFDDAKMRYLEESKATSAANKTLLSEFDDNDYLVETVVGNTTLEGLQRIRGLFNIVFSGDLSPSEIVANFQKFYTDHQNIKELILNIGQRIQNGENVSPIERELYNRIKEASGITTQYNISQINVDDSFIDRIRTKMANFIQLLGDYNWNSMITWIAGGSIAIIIALLFYVWYTQKYRGQTNTNMVTENVENIAAGLIMEGVELPGGTFESLKFPNTHETGFISQILYDIKHFISNNINDASEKLTQFKRIFVNSEKINTYIEEVRNNTYNVVSPSQIDVKLLKYVDTMKEALGLYEDQHSLTNRFIYKWNEIVANHPDITTWIFLGPMGVFAAILFYLWYKNTYGNVNQTIASSESIVYNNLINNANFPLLEFRFLNDDNLIDFIQKELQNRDYRAVSVFTQYAANKEQVTSDVRDELRDKLSKLRPVFESILRTQSDAQTDAALAGLDADAAKTRAEILYDKFMSGIEYFKDFMSSNPTSSLILKAFLGGSVLALGLCIFIMWYKKYYKPDAITTPNTANTAEVAAAVESDIVEESMFRVMI